MIGFIEIFLPIFSFSNLLFALLLGGSFSILLSVLGVRVSIFHAFLPMDKVNEKLYEIVEIETNQETLDLALLYFNTNFNTENPVTSDIEIDKKIELLE